MVNTKPAINNIALIGVCAALMTALQFAMSGLVNVEPVTLLVILFSQQFKKQTPYIIYVFVLLEGLLYGFGIWWMTYLYVWMILYVAVRVAGNLNSVLVWALIAGIFGLLFGTLCSIPYWITMGLAGAVAWIMSGLYFDLVHCLSNFAVVLLLWKPLSTGLSKLNKQLGFMHENQ